MDVNKIEWWVLLYNGVVSNWADEVNLNGPKMGFLFGRKSGF